MERSYTLLRRLRLIFGISIVILLISSGASYFSIQKLIENSRLVNHTYDVILKAESVFGVIKDGETGQRGYIITMDPAFLDPYRGALDTSMHYLKELELLTTDNPVQQGNIKDLRGLVEKRFVQLEQTMQAKKLGNGSPESLQRVTQGMEAGRMVMKQIRFAVDKIKDSETELLAKRTAQQSRYISYTPILLVNAAFIAIIITIIAYRRIKSDLDNRIAQQKEEEEKYLETSRRISIMENVTRQIASGNYAVRSIDDQKDELGRISEALNNMAVSLETNFNTLNDKDYVQTGTVNIAAALRGQKSVEETANNVLNSLASYLDLPIAALYVNNDTANTLELTAGFALSGAPQYIKRGEGFLGQAFAQHDVLMLSNIPPDLLTVNAAVADVRPTAITVVPLYMADRLLGALALGSIYPLDKIELEFLDNIREAIAIGLNSAINLKKLQELFEEVQAQTEELQAQHNELENINAELEAQAQKLQASEEELKVQQEELMQVNEELEGRAALLEEKNEMIVSKNLEIQHKAEQLEQSTKYKSEFLANMSHELRTPLNSILLLSRLLSENNEQNLTAEQVEYASVIQSSGNGLLALIDEILDLSKIEAGKMELDYQLVSVEEIARDMRSLFSPAARDKKLDFIIDIEGNASIDIETDKMRLEQILKNLLSNAIKFTSDGFVRMDITATGRDYVHFAVKDSGIGISQEKQDLVFEAFRQADGSTRRKYGGTGLGLSISRELAKLLGGEIQLDSTSGEGSVFTVTIPIKKLSGTNKIPAVPATGSETEEQQPEYTTSNFVTQDIPENVPDDRDDVKDGDKAILIVEDDTNFAKALLNFTRKKKYKGIIAVRGDEGIELAKKYRPTAILLDIQLPVKDGWQVMEALKNDITTRHIPVHIMSSLEMKKESLQKGAVDFINKPVAFEQMKQIFSRIENFISKESRKVLIVEENAKHAKALAYFLENFAVGAEITDDIGQSMQLLKRQDVDCVILDMGVPDKKGYDMLETIKKNPEFEHLPIIIFTGKSLSSAEEMKIKQYADSIVVKTAHSYQRMLDEISLFLHLVEEQKDESVYRKKASLTDVLEGKTVLIADDDVRNIFSLTKALETHKVNVISAIDGKEALNQLKQNPNIDIVLMDMMMPELDGYETTKMIRNNPLYRNLPVIAVTAKAMTGDREKCIKAGASDYISKPVDFDQLISLLRVWLYEKMN